MIIYAGLECCIANAIVLLLYLLVIKVMVLHIVCVISLSRWVKFTCDVGLFSVFPVPVGLPFEYELYPKEE